MRRRLGLATSVLGLLALVAGVLWTPLLVPRLVRFPGSLDETLRFEGTALLPLDAGTGLPLATPLELPLQLDRRLRSTDGGTGAKREVVAEDITLRLGDRDIAERHQYVINRRDMTLDADPRSWAYDPANVVDRLGSYRLNFPLGTKADGAYQVWNNETGATITLGKGTKTRLAKADIDVIQFPISYRRPVADYLGPRLTTLGLPAEITPAQLGARLAGAGLDLQALAAALGPKLSAEQAASLGELLRTPLPLRYEFFFEEVVSVEPRTGIIVDLNVTSEGFAAKPDLSSLAAIEPILAANASVPAVAEAAEMLPQLQSQPADTVLDLRYRATDATVIERGDEARSKARQIRLAEFWAPWSLGIGGAVLIAAGVALFLRGRPTAKRGGPPTTPSVEPGEHVYLTTREPQPSNGSTDARPPAHA